MPDIMWEWNTTNEHQYKKECLINSYFDEVEHLSKEDKEIYLKVKKAEDKVIKELGWEWNIIIPDTEKWILRPLTPWEKSAKAKKIAVEKWYITQEEVDNVEKHVKSIFIATKKCISKFKKENDDKNNKKDTLE